MQRRSPQMCGNCSCLLLSTCQPWKEKRKKSHPSPSGPNYHMQNTSSSSSQNTRTHTLNAHAQHRHCRPLLLPPLHSVLPAFVFVIHRVAIEGWQWRPSLPSGIVDGLRKLWPVASCQLALLTRRPCTPLAMHSGRAAVPRPPVAGRILERRPHSGVSNGETRTACTSPAGSLRLPSDQPSCRLLLPRPRGETQVRCAQF